MRTKERSSDKKKLKPFNRNKRQRSIIHLKSEKFIEKWFLKNKYKNSLIMLHKNKIRNRRILKSV